MDSVLFVEKSSKRVVIGGTKAKLQLPSLHTQNVVIVSEALDRKQVLVFEEVEFYEKFEPWDSHAFDYSEAVVKEAAIVFKYFQPEKRYSGPIYCDRDKLKDLLREYGVPERWRITFSEIYGISRRICYRLDIDVK